ncbi:hypothetical protein O6H91_08G019700 [Diphasiastrum complanatum]|uniref:Uncharacterized protein n=1 Tax=Diphasiastrum complanatum TaxID=34168 RepID=A0ACC2CVE1_DIPCM|nr:hypothetical protein O6H91_08G019700 [Diphasiastrum complanatum]
MESVERLCLSQKLRQVCLDTATTSASASASTRSAEGNVYHSISPADGLTAISENEVLDMLSSQDFFCTPDFVTPTEQQIVVDFDGNKEKGNVSPPKGLTPMRSKRPRPGWLSGNHPHSELEIYCSDLPLEAHFSSFSASKCEQLYDDTASCPSSTNARLAALRRRALSPPCIKNPFLYNDPEIGTSTNKLRAKFQGAGTSCLSRYREEFHEIQEIGLGNFSRVFKVLKRIDGCFYAIKRSLHQLRQDGQRRQAINEVQALAAIDSHENVVRYHTAWFENDYLYIQMELCDNSLRSWKAEAYPPPEKSLLGGMLQIIKALAHIHSHGLVHLDIKPDNIYVRKGIYKLGDFGRATRLDGSISVEEGDSRYMPLEILNEDYSQLQKADIFALGATFYELARGSPLTSSGTQFQALRQGKHALLPGFSLPFQNLLKGLMHPISKMRPTAADLLNHALFNHGKDAYFVQHLKR